MDKRKLIIGTYDTAQQHWTLAEWSFSSPEYQDNFVTVPGRDGALDLSATLTNGAPAYNNRTLTARLELSEGTRLTREEAISTMINQLDGCRFDIVLPDDPGHYISGRVSIAREYNNPAHASVSVTAVCDPWRYAKDEVVYELTANEEAQTASLANSGRRRAVPVVDINGDPSTADKGTNPDAALILWDSSTHDGTQVGTIPQGATFLIAGQKVNGYLPVKYNDLEGWINGSFVVYLAAVVLVYGGSSWSLDNGRYQLPELTLPQGGGTLSYSGSGTVTITYREAVL